MLLLQCAAKKNGLKDEILRNGITLKLAVAQLLFSKKRITVLLFLPAVNVYSYLASLASKIYLYIKKS